MKDMDELRYQFIRKLNAQLDELPDGAFLGVMEEHGVSVSELRRFAIEFERRHDSYIKPKHKRRKL
jgi:hypothetical protein